MSSACVCHTDEKFCFYCEIYTPLERKHEEQSQAIERVIAEIEESQYSAVRNKYEGGFNVGLRLATRKLKEVLEAEADHTRIITGNERDSKSQ